MPFFYIVIFLVILKMIRSSTNCRSNFFAKECLRVFKTISVSNLCVFTHASKCQRLNNNDMFAFFHQSGQEIARFRTPISKHIYTHEPMFGIKNAIARTAAIIVAVIIIVVAVAGGYFALASISSHTTTSSTNSSLPSVTLGFAGTADVTDLPALVLWQIYGPQVGLNIHVIYLGTDASIPEGLVSGSIQIGESGFAGVLQSSESAGNSSGNYPFVAFTSYEAINDFGIVVSNSIQNWSDLANKPIAVEAIGSDTDIFCHLSLTQHGIPKSEQNCLPTGDAGSRLDALLAGKVYGDWTEPYQMITADQTGKFHILETIPHEIPGLIGSLLYTTKTFAQANPDIIVKMTEAMMLAHRWAWNETAWLQKEQIDFPGTNATLAATSWKVWIAMGLWAPNGGFDFNEANFSENYYLQQQEINSFLPISNWADFSYEQQALSAIGNYSGPANGYVNPNIPTINASIPGDPSAIFGGGLGSTGVLSISTFGTNLVTPMYSSSGLCREGV
jgi:ABC-type nitrate/sulfonate/bicarbonate transport system substrate-binding protein